MTEGDIKHNKILNDSIDCLTKHRCILVGKDHPEYDGLDEHSYISAYGIWVDQKSGDEFNESIDKTIKMIKSFLYV